MPIWRQIEWIKRYAGGNLCVGEPQKGFFVTADTRNNHIFIAGACLLFVYLMTLSTLIWMEFTKDSEIVEKEKDSGDEIQTEEGMPIGKHGERAGENEKCGSRLILETSESRSNPEKNASQFSLKSNENGSQLGLKQSGHRF